jgi:steroid 5-alpha reductase family enzyme
MDTDALVMSVWLQMAILAAIMVSLMTLGWHWQRRHSNAGIVDVLWSIGVGLGAVLMALTGGGAAIPRTVLAILGDLWATRLTLHLWRRVRSEDEDGRYRQLRLHWRGSQWNFFLFFQFQALLVLLFALPFVAVAQNPTHGVTPAMMLGVAIWIVGVAGESIADRQLARFRHQPLHSGRTCREGLWRYSRHPNYFFEWLHWFAYVALAWGSPLALLAWSGPIVMYVFLRWISGVTYTEVQALRTRGDDYREYQRTTPMLIPWFPKSTISDRTSS